MASSSIGAPDALIMSMRRDRRRTDIEVALLIYRETTIMARMASHKTRILLAATLVALAAACDGDAALSPDGQSAVLARGASLPEPARTATVLATLRRATARYHDLNAALADGFVFLHACEVRPGEGAVGTVYVHFERLMDGVIDPSLPDALVYEPAADATGRPRLVAAEMAIPFALWSQPGPPNFVGADFQPEDEFGVYGLHVWIWRRNPDGMFAEANPHVSCGDDVEE